MSYLELLLPSTARREPIWLSCTSARTVAWRSTSRTSPQNPHPPACVAYRPGGYSLPRRCPGRALRSVKARNTSASSHWIKRLHRRIRCLIFPFFSLTHNHSTCRNVHKISLYTVGSLQPHSVHILRHRSIKKYKASSSKDELCLNNILRAWFLRSIDRSIDFKDEQVVLSSELLEVKPGGTYNYHSSLNIRHNITLTSLIFTLYLSHN
jgi:hypothetical protein